MWPFSQKRSTSTAGESGKDCTMTLVEQIGTAEQTQKDQRATEWAQLDEILTRADKPQHSDGAKMLELGSKLSIPVDQLKGAAELAVMLNNRRIAVGEAEKQLEGLRARIADAERIIADSEKLVKKAEAERARILADVPGEVAQLRLVAECCAALIDQRGHARSLFLRSRGWVNIHMGWRKQKDPVEYTSEGAARIEAAAAAGGYLREFEGKWAIDVSAKKTFQPEASTQQVPTAEQKVPAEQKSAEPVVNSQAPTMEPAQA
jgi:hypothetical protein